jgi:hypothetical protein
MMNCCKMVGYAIVVAIFMLYAAVYIETGGIFSLFVSVVIAGMFICMLIIDVCNRRID